MTASRDFSSHVEFRFRIDGVGGKAVVFLDQVCIARLKH